jgi:hypothetical protein
MAEGRVQNQTGKTGGFLKSKLLWLLLAFELTPSLSWKERVFDAQLITPFLLQREEAGG